MESGATQYSPLLRTHFASMERELGGHGPIASLIRLLAEGELTDEAFQQVAESNGVRKEPWFRGQLLDLILGYIRTALSDHPRLSSENQQDVHRLRRHFEVGDGEFMERRPAEIAAILNEQLAAILEDGIIDAEEELYQVELQAAFGIGYDDYLRVCRLAIENAFFDLTARAERDSDVRPKLRALEPLYRLAALQSRTLGSLF